MTLHRTGFTWQRSLLRSGELLPRLSTLTMILWLAPQIRRYISVALSLGSPPAAVSRYPCPMKLGLSSDAGFHPAPATARLAHVIILIHTLFYVNSFFLRAYGSSRPRASGTGPHSSCAGFQTG